MVGVRIEFVVSRATDDLNWQKIIIIWVSLIVASNCMWNLFSPIPKLGHRI